MTLYELAIEKEKAILECMDEETGEIIDPERLSLAFENYNEKIENIMLSVKDLKAKAKAIKDEKMALAHRQEVLEHKADSLMDYLQSVLNGDKFESAKGVISYRKSESVEIDLAEFLQNDDAYEYLKIAEPQPNKTDIKAAIKGGKTFKGATLVTKQNMQIK